MHNCHEQRHCTIQTRCILLVLVCAVPQCWVWSAQGSRQNTKQRGRFLCAKVVASVLETSRSLTILLSPDLQTKIHKQRQDTGLCEVDRGNLYLQFQKYSGLMTLPGGTCLSSKESSIKRHISFARGLLLVWELTFFMWKSHPIA